MDAQNKERWLQLCELAATEQDPHKLFQLVQEINRLLEEKEGRLKTQTAGSQLPTKEEGRPNSQRADGEI
jgi:hypothetical protein